MAPNTFSFYAFSLRRPQGKHPLTVILIVGATNVPLYYWSSGPSLRFWMKAFSKRPSETHVLKYGQACIIVF